MKKGGELRSYYKEKEVLEKGGEGGGERRGLMYVYTFWSTTKKRLLVDIVQIFVPCKVSVDTTKNKKNGDSVIQKASML